MYKIKLEDKLFGGVKDYDKLIEKIKILKYGLISVGISLYISYDKQINIGNAIGGSTILFYKDFFTASGSHLICFYNEISQVKITDDDNKSITDTIVGGLIGGGIGALATNISKSSKFYIQLILKNGDLENFYCGKKTCADEFYHALTARCELQKNNSIEERLNQLKKMYEMELIDENEYKDKKQSVISEI